MNGKLLAEVVIKAFGIIMLANYVAQLPSLWILLDPPQVPTFMQDMQPQNSGGLFFKALVSTSGSLISGVLLIAFGASVAERVVPDTSHLKLNMNAFEFGMISFAMAGVIIATSGLLSLVRALLTAITGGSAISMSSGSFFPSFGFASAGSACVQVAIGVLLVCKQQSIARILMPELSRERGSQSGGFGG